MPELTFYESIQKFQKSLNVKMKIDELSVNTIDSYNRTYKYFILFCKQYDKKLSFQNIKEDDIYAFIEYKSANMNKQGNLSNSSVNSIVSHLKKLFKHIERNSDESYDFDKVFEDIKVKQSVRIPKGIDDKAFSKIVKYLEELKLNETFINFRNITLFKFLLYGGLRASEAISITLSSVELDISGGLYKIVFKGKGDKNRTTYIKEDLLYDELDTLRNVFKIDTHKPIALTTSGKAMDRVQLSKMVNSAYCRAGVKATGVHILRHTAAKRLLADGVSIVVVQSILGHGSIQTTSIYANPTESIIKKELTK
ncbi:tyrosine-type recombinase/integrase [Sulfurimonas sp.]|uniref:tyrosine-type recombinase/integrase n=1 Tax=Sulfurimonas sp. TaxID=2022749 RepID=UPI0025DF07E2|nr:tyrosine-type recombinase/integrase [Sulfurimonas sp.]